MLDAVRNAFRLPDLRRKLLITLNTMIKNQSKWLILTP